MSDQESEAHGGGSPVVSRNCSVDAVTAAVLFGIGAVVMFEARRLGADWTDDGPGSGYFMFYIALILCIGSIGVFWQAVFSASRDRDAFVDREQLGRVLSVFGPALVYVLAIEFVGIYVASAAYIALFMIVLGKYAVGRSVMLALLINAVLFLMFEAWFKVPLYKGRLEPLAFLGY